MCWLGLPFLQQAPGRESRQRAKGLPHLFSFSWESQYCAVCCTKSENSFLIVHDRGKCFDPFTPSWPEMEVQLLHIYLYIRQKDKPQEWRQGYSCYNNTKQHVFRVLSKMESILVCFD